jgi:tripartite-type tricarboxylate transporter receptor subunit TctC
MSFVATRFLLALALLVSCGSKVAFAEDAYPSRTIRLVVGFAAGGSTDIPARYVADKLGALLGQRVIVENKPAAAGMLATRDVRRARAAEGRLQSPAVHAL